MAIEVVALPESVKQGIADPRRDPILAVCIAVHNDAFNWDGGAPTFVGAIVVSEDTTLAGRGVLVVDSELALFDELARFINRWDPELLVGYDFLRGSWHYVCERADYLAHNFVRMANRVKGEHFRIASECKMLSAL